jgi:hypothetical protein
MDRQVAHRFAMCSYDTFAVQSIKIQEQLPCLLNVGIRGWVDEAKVRQ